MSAAAEDAVWHCMLDNPHQFFSPMLAQFNSLYQLIRENKRPSPSTEQYTEQMMVRRGGA